MKSLIRISLFTLLLAGSLTVPALAQTQDGAVRAPNQGIGRVDNDGHVGHGMMSRGGMMGAAPGRYQP